MARPYLGGSSAGVETLSEAVTLGVKDNGKVFILTKASSYAVTLPPCSTSVGFVATFINGDGLSGNVDITADPADSMYGILLTGEADATDSNEYFDANDYVRMVGAQSVQGDRVDVMCDGSRWYTYGYAGDKNHIDGAG